MSEETAKAMAIRSYAGDVDRALKPGTITILLKHAVVTKPVYGCH